MGPDRPTINVLAGVNGAGKSSLLGEMQRELGVPFHNPDIRAAELRKLHPEWTVELANAKAWQEGVAALRYAIARGLNYTFETTLAGRTISGLLERAARQGHRLSIAYVGLSGGLEQHLARVAARVALGGHDIPGEMIAHRLRTSRRNLVRLIHLVDDLLVFDNSVDVDPTLSVQPPAPTEVFRVIDHRLERAVSVEQCPEWARPLLVEAIRLYE